jgi:KDO2-lipid IV(A) lauroyltransferase
MWRYWGFRAALFVAARVPRMLGYPLAALGGEAYFWLNPGHSRTAVDNFTVLLAEVSGAPRPRDTARRSFRNYGKYLFDFFRLSSVDPDTIEDDVRVEGFEHLDAALARGRGVMLVLPHFGNWDLAGALVAARGYPIVSIADQFSPPALDRLVRRTRERAGMGIISLDRGGNLRHIGRALARNQIVSFVVDRPQREGGVEVEFFGSPAWVPSGPARFALRTGAAILPGYIGRRPGDHTYFGRVEPPVEFARTGDEHADMQGLTQAIIHRLEGLLRDHPDQWYMFRHMWKSEHRSRNAE